MRWAGNIARISDTKNAYKILVGKPEGKRPFNADGRIILRLMLEK
jgi:hypothetical protein